MSSPSNSSITSAGTGAGADTGLSATRSAATSSAGVSPRPAAGTELETTHGRTTVADAVVSKVAGVAARDVAGIHGFGAGAARALGAISERITGGRTSTSQGVSVEVGDRQAAIDLTVVIDYGAPIAAVASAVRQNVIATVERMTGLQVVEVNVHVADLYQASGDNDTRDDEDRTPPSRVR